MDIYGKPALAWLVDRLRIFTVSRQAVEPGLDLDQPPGLTMITQGDRDLFSLFPVFNMQRLNQIRRAKTGGTRFEGFNRRQHAA